MSQNPDWWYYGGGKDAQSSSRERGVLVNELRERFPADGADTAAKNLGLQRDAFEDAGAAVVVALRPLNDEAVSHILPMHAARFAIQVVPERQEGFGAIEGLV